MKIFRLKKKVFSEDGYSEKKCAVKIVTVKKGVCNADGYSKEDSVQ